MIRSRQSRTHPRLPRVTRSQNPSFLLGSPEERYSWRLYEFTRGKPPPRGDTNACPPFRIHNGGWVTPYQGIRKERLVSCNAIFFDPRGRVIYMYTYISTRFTRETHVAWKTMAKILRYTSIHVNSSCWRCVLSFKEKW